MTDFLAEQARLRPALDRLLGLAAGWADPIVATNSGPDGSAIADNIAARSTWDGHGGTVDERPPWRNTGGNSAGNVAAVAGTDALGALEQTDRFAAPDRFATGPDPLPAAAAPGPGAKVGHPDMPTVLPRFRLALARRGQGGAPVRGFVAASPGTTAGLSARLGSRQTADGFIPNGMTATMPVLAGAEAGAGPGWIPLGLAPSVAPPDRGPNSLRPPPNAGREPLSGSRQAMPAGFGEPGAFFGAFAGTFEAELEERIADILERAAMDAGIDLP